MNLKLKRTTRTPHSEEISIYDVDTRDSNDEPVSIGKIDLHYIEDQVVGTLLIWQEYATGFRQSQGSGTGTTLDELIDALLSELTEPVGVSATYAVEVYYPSFSGQGFVSNYPDESDEESSFIANRDSILTEGEPEEAQEEEIYPADERRKDDEFADRLRERP